MSGSQGNRPVGPRQGQRAAARWVAKFRDAGEGLIHGVRTQESLWVHCVCAVAVVAVAAALRVEPWRWGLLVLCIASVIACELFNSAIEQLVRVLHPQRASEIAVALHLAAAAVLVVSLAAVVVGLMVFGPPLLRWLGG